MNFDDVKHALSGDNSESPGTRFGLKFDPLAYLFGKKYRALINKTGDTLNSTLAPIQKKVNKFDRKINPIHRAIDRTEIGGKVKQWVENKPGSTMGLVYGAGAAYGGLAGGGASGGGATGSDLGIFSNGGTGGMGGVGGGNAGALANSGGIEGGAGMGSATEGGSGAFDWQSLAKQGLSQQSQEQQHPTPYQGQSDALEQERQKREAEELQRRQMLAAAMRQQGMYTPA